MAFDKILLLIDNSKPSDAAVKQCYDLAADLRAKVTLVFVIDKALAMGDVDAGIFPDQAMKALKAEGEKLLHHFVKKHNKNVHTDVLMPVGELEEVIPGIISQTGAKLIVMGTHGRAGLDHLITGSVAEHVLKISTIPVLVVPVKD